MSKVVSAANAMIVGAKKISPVLLGQTGKEIFFTYDGKHNWSMTHPEDNYFLFFYPSASNYSIEQLARINDPEEWEQLPMVRYDASELGTREAMETFAELYTLIKEKVYGVDAVLDDIIDDLF